MTVNDHSNNLNSSNIIDRLAEINNLPMLDLTSSITNIPQLSNLDGDLHMPIENNFGYYTPEEFRANNNIKECSLNRKAFGAVHCNIRSLAANHDSLCEFLRDLDYPLSLIGITDTKFAKANIHVMNVDLEGYEFIHEPSYTNAGGVGFYVRNDIKYLVRTDLTTSNNDFEMLWIEISTNGQANLICGVVYRHPNNNIDEFIKSLESIIERIHRENKLCLFLGDFNIDLMKIETHAESEQFINTLACYFFQPHILQPTRITNHSATLIDNIFFNSIEHFMISGNLVYDLTDHLPNFIIINNFSNLIYLQKQAFIKEITQISRRMISLVKLA